MNDLMQWMRDWNVPGAALPDLLRRLGAHDVPVSTGGGSEQRQQGLIRLEAAKRGMLLWRNNVGALLDQRGVPVRYGLAKESKQQNEVMKSGDLIGIRAVLIQPWHVGTTIGQFVSRECKRPGWVFKGDAHEQAQANWAALVIKYGGDAKFATGEGSFA